MRRVSRLLLVALSLLLLGAQQAAVAHLIAHVGASAQVVAQNDDERHGAALTLSHVCTACLSFVALDAGAAPALPLMPGCRLSFAAPDVASSTRPSARPPGRYFARAPPIALR